MRTRIDSYNTIAKGLKIDYPQLTDFEVLKLAIQIERNQILENGLVVSTDDSSPAGLEAIAIALGYTNRISTISITSLLQDLVEKK
ncbi:MAG: histidine kinase [Flavobacterium sp.]